MGERYCGQFFFATETPHFLLLLLFFLTIFTIQWQISLRSNFDIIFLFFKINLNTNKLPIEKVIVKEMNQYFLKINFIVDIIFLFSKINLNNRLKK